jgi:hypothetical protein
VRSADNSRSSSPDLHATAETDRARLLEHAETLADLERVTSASPSEVAAHAWVVRDSTAGLVADPVGAKT